MLGRCDQGQCGDRVRAAGGDAGQRLSTRDRVQRAQRDDQASHHPAIGCQYAHR